jgi:murein DD-endopeptidase MepM/ murein hydrolase activator NlpD
MAAIFAAGSLLGGWSQSADGAVPHVVQPGETLWSIAAANNLTTRTVAAFNGMTEDAGVIAGQTIDVPTVDEGAAALASPGATTSAATPPEDGVAAEPVPESAGPPPPTADTHGLGHIPSPWGELHLAPAAADSWNAMREEALGSLGVDLQPAGPVSAFRDAGQQGYLYDLFLAGQGAPANPPGTSSHELGVAVDVATPDMRRAVDQIGATYGWYGTIPSEWWHVEYVG